MKHASLCSLTVLSLLFAIALFSCKGEASTSADSIEQAPAFVSSLDYAIPSDLPALGTAEQGVYLEPLCWWVGMNTPLQLMAHADDIGLCDVRTEGSRHVRVKSVHKADSPNYLFIDVEIDSKAKPTDIELVFSREGKEVCRQRYSLYARAEGSALRQGFSTADLVYLIMPDRFANGDPGNDNSPMAEERADRSNSFGRHGGDLQGIIDHLDYLDTLGVTAIWCTPLTFDNEPRASFHGYAASDYVHIDPRYGSNSIFKKYVEACHSKGIKVIMDFVPNHCGARHWWMNDLPFTDWIHQFPTYTKSNFCFSPNMDVNASRKDLFYQESGWFDRAMPDMNLDNPFVLHYFQQVAIWWVEWSGLDGIRIDTYPYNEKVPASQLCKAITDEYPSLNIVGECWTLSVPQLAYWQGGNPNADGFDSHLPSIMDFPLREALVRGIPENNPGWGEGLTRVYDALSHDFAFHDLSHMLIFAANHDTERLGSIVHGSADRMKMITALLATMRGIPQIYYGDEQMFLSTDDAGDSAWRREFSGGWEGDAANLFSPEGRSPEQEDLYRYNSRLWQWRKTSEAVQMGKTLHFLTRDNTYAFFRYIPDERDADLTGAEGKHPVKSAVFVYANNSSVDKTLPWSYYDEFTSRLPDGCAVSTLSQEDRPTACARGTDVASGLPVVVSDNTLVPAGKTLVVEFK